MPAAVRAAARSLPDQLGEPLWSPAARHPYTAEAVELAARHAGFVEEAERARTGGNRSALAAARSRVIGLVPEAVRFVESHRLTRAADYVRLFRSLAEVEGVAAHEVVAFYGHLLESHYGVEDALGRLARGEDFTLRTQLDGWREHLATTGVPIAHDLARVTDEGRAKAIARYQRMFDEWRVGLRAVLDGMDTVEERNRFLRRLVDENPELRRPLRDLLPPDDRPRPRPPARPATPAAPAGPERWVATADPTQAAEVRELVEHLARIGVDPADIFGTQQPSPGAWRQLGRIVLVYRFPEPLRDALSEAAARFGLANGGRGSSADFAHGYEYYKNRFDELFELISRRSGSRPAEAMAAAKERLDRLDLSRLYTRDQAEVQRLRPGRVTVDPGLDGAALEAELRRNADRIGFNSTTSAAYHARKHAPAVLGRQTNQPVQDYFDSLADIIRHGNVTMREADTGTMVEFSRRVSEGGTSHRVKALVVVNKWGRVFAASYLQQD